MSSSTLRSKGDEGGATHPSTRKTEPMDARCPSNGTRERHRSARYLPRVEKASRFRGAAFHHEAPRPARAMHQGEQSSWVRTMRKHRPARGRANDDVWHPGSSAVWPFAGSAFADGSWPVARRTSCGSPSRDVGVSGDEGCSAVNEMGLDPTSRRIPPLGAVGPRNRAIVARRSSRTRLAFSGYGRRASAVRTAWATMQHESPVSGKRPGIPFFVARRMAALSRARAAVVGEDHAFDGLSAHDRSSGRSRTTTSQPERATPRETRALHRPDSGRGRNPGSEPTSGLGSRWQSRETEATHRVR
jgi:hypothetical protein